MEFTKEQLEVIDKMIQEKTKKETKPESPKPKEDPKPQAEKSDLDKEIEVAEKKLKLKKIQKETEDLGKTEQEEDDLGGFVVNGNATTTEQATEEDWKTISELTK